MSNEALMIISLLYGLGMTNEAFLLTIYARSKGDELHVSALLVGMVGWPVFALFGLATLVNSLIKRMT